MMRILLTLGCLAMTALPAWADGGVATVVPNRPDVPIIINGVDASWAVVEGDWGLARGIHVQPTVYGGRNIDDDRHVGRYFPSSGKIPGYGRLEIESPVRRPRRAESYTRSWRAQSEPARAPDAANAPPVVIEAPYGAAPGNNDPAMRHRRN